LNSKGNPQSLLVGETKFDTSQLGKTKAGTQMGQADTAKKLHGLAARLRDISKQNGLDMKPRPPPLHLNKRQQVAIPLDQNSSVSFWRDPKSRNWNYDGPDGLQGQAQRQLTLLADYLDGAAEGRIAFRKRIFIWKLAGDKLLLTVKDASLLREGMKLAMLSGQELPPISLASAPWAKKAFVSAYSKEIIRKLPNLPRREAIEMADQVFATSASARNAAQILAPQSYTAFAGVRAIRAGLLGAALGGVFDYAFGAEPLQRSRMMSMALLSGGSAAIGNLAGDAAVPLMMKSQFATGMAVRTAGFLGLGSTSRVLSASGTGFGGGIASIVFAYGGYAMGYHDLTTANQSAIAGVMGVGGGALAYAGTLSLVAAYGTAGTGVAISSLSGAAATNAGLALLGGGTAASGGGGMAAGTAVMGTGVGVVVVGVTVAVMYGFHLYDESQDNKRISLTLENLSVQ
ncbi:MAG: hypothetical protein Q8M07_19025, partial [Prosthecobacter sp.]|nr:hypothetical protein [Prosthecobacter sp.]